MNALVSMGRSLWRFHRLMAAVLILEYALAFAIVLTAVGVLVSRAQAIYQPSGIDEPGLYVLAGMGGVEHYQLVAAKRRFEPLVGRKNLALGSSVPFFGRLGDVESIRLPEQTRQTPPLQAVGYAGGQQMLNVLGLTILRGRGFRSDEIARRSDDTTHVVILSETLSRRLFHDQSAVGKQVLIGGRAHVIIGVVNPLAAPGGRGGGRTAYTFLLPDVSWTGELVLMRYNGSLKKLAAVYRTLRKHDAGKVNWYLWRYGDLRANYFHSDRLTARILAIVVIVVLITALCGVLGLTRYWISQRRAQIAIRRALGAKKHDITVRFVGESMLLVVLGLMIGTVVDFFFSSYLGVMHFEGGVSAWFASVALVSLMAAVVTWASLRHWLRMEPVKLMRAL